MILKEILANTLEIHNYNQELINFQKRNPSGNYIKKCICGINERFMPYKDWIKQLELYSFKYKNDEIDIDGIFICHSKYYDEFHKYTMHKLKEKLYSGICDNGEQFLNYFNSLNLEDKKYILLMEPVFNKSEIDGNAIKLNTLDLDDVEVIYEFHIYELEE
jgi:hypothetical protein